MRNYQTKSNDGGGADSITATNHGAGEYNSIAVELEGSCTSAGLSLAPANGVGEDSTQLAQSLSIYGAGGAQYHIDTGVANAYVLNPVAPRQSPLAYFTGFTVSFVPNITNTGPSTINVGSIGVVNLRNIHGQVLTGNEVNGRGYVTARYDGTYFRIINTGRENIHYSAVSSLRASMQIPINGQPVFLEGYYSNGDGGGQVLVWTLASTATDNGVTVFKGTGIGTGRYVSLSTEDLTVDNAGAKGDGTTDEKSYFDTALSVLGIARLNDAKNYRIATTLTMPARTGIVGTNKKYAKQLTSDLTVIGGKLLVDNSATIELNSSTFFIDNVVLPYGMVFPQNYVDSYPNASGLGGTGWQGDALTIIDDSVGQYIGHSMIVGFENGIYSNNTIGGGRVTIEHMNMDNQNCIILDNYVDTCYVDHVHCWPFGSNDGPSGGGAYFNARSGIAVSLINAGDTTKVTNSFSYGYAGGFVVNSCNGVVVDNCFADQVYGAAGVTGHPIDDDETGVGRADVSGVAVYGTSGDTIVTNCGSFGQNIGVNVATGNGYFTDISNCVASGINRLKHGVLVSAGNALINGGMNRDTLLGVTVENTTGTSEVIIDGVAFDNCSVLPIGLGTTANDKVTIKNPILLGSATGGVISSGVLAVTTVASATALSIPTNKDVFHVSGTTTITSIVGGFDTREIKMIFDSTAQVTDGGNMRLAGNFTGGADRTLKMVLSGDVWYETSRSTN